MADEIERPKVSLLVAKLDGCKQSDLECAELHELKPIQSNRKMLELSDKSAVLHRSLVLLVICIAMNSVYGTANAQDKLETDDQSSNFHDPIVWDASSLYKDTQSIATSSRQKRSTTTNQQQQQQQSIDACPSKTEVLTPYYATNSKGKLRTVVHNEPMLQAIQVETCVR